MYKRTRLLFFNRDMNLSCDLVSLIDGKIPATDKNVLKQHDDFTQGQGVEISLVDLLSKQLGMTDPEIKRIGNLHRTLNIRGCGAALASLEV